MAIMQERYVRITSTNVGSSAIQERDLNGLLFTLGRGWIGEGAFGTDAILKCYSVDQVRKYFSSASDEVKFAQKYFAYISPSGSTPASLSFARVSVYTEGTSVDNVLSYEYDSGSSSMAWVTPKTFGKDTITFLGAKTSGVILGLYLKDSAPTPGVDEEKTLYTFKDVLTAQNDVLLGDTPEETAVNFAAVINGTGGFYGQKANPYISAVAEGSKVIITARTAGEDGTPWFVPSDDQSVVSVATSTKGSDGGTVVVGPEFESPSAALSRVNVLSNNFGSFAFLTGDATVASWTNSDFKDVLTQNAGYNYKYLASVGILPNNGDFSDTTKEVAFVQAVGTQNGAAANRGADGTCAAIPMAIFGAIDYSGTGTAPNFMFKQISGESATVFDDSVADMLDGLHVNYYGQTQVNGQQLSFYQRGFNLDGEDTAVYCNEVWLKSHIATAIFNLLTSVERVPANTDGEAMIYTTIAGAAQQAITNGTIVPGKILTPEQRSLAYQLTGDRDAYMTIQNAGFWLDVVIEQDGTEYKAIYKLVYGKGDSIRMVEGTDILM